MGCCTSGHVRHALGCQQNAGHHIKEPVLCQPLEDGILLNNQDAAALESSSDQFVLHQAKLAGL